MCIYIYIYTHIHIYTYTHIHIYTYTYTYIHIFDRLALHLAKVPREARGCPGLGFDRSGVNRI